MEFWLCPHCGQRIYGSLEIVLTRSVASVHTCRTSVARVNDTTCLSCITSPTGLCAYHAGLLVNQNHLSATRISAMQ